MTARILVVDDDPLICEQLSALFSDAGFAAIATSEPQEAMELLGRETYDLGVVDLKMPNMDGITLMQEMRTRAPTIDFIMITGHASIKGAVEAIRMGASDYITKPFDRDDILLATQKVLERRRLLDEIDYLRKQLSERYSFAHMVSRNAVMLELFSTVEMLAESDTTVVINGESGTGKELVARALHFQGKRKSGRFVPINCAGLPEQLLESELFGFEKGAFTGAAQERVGKIEWASGGTLFLDEIESIPLSMQMKLLRVLEVRNIERLGGNRQIPVDLRIVAATNQSLEEAVRAGRMREDFYYRIHVMPLRIPPLRERLEDIPLLAVNFLQNHPLAQQKGIQGLSDHALAQLTSYNWPGNIRELMNVLERAALRTKTDMIPEVDVGALQPSKAALVPGDEQPFDVPLKEYVRGAERNYLSHLLERYQGGIGPSARHAAVDQATLHRKIKSHGLRPGAFRGRNGAGPSSQD
jgi:DNA-binding NtrC family response regulator